MSLLILHLCTRERGRERERKMGKGERERERRRGEGEREREREREVLPSITYVDLLYSLQSLGVQLDPRNYNWSSCRGSST